MGYDPRQGFFLGSEAAGSAGTGQYGGIISGAVRGRAPERWVARALSGRICGSWPPGKSPRPKSWYWPQPYGVPAPVALRRCTGVAVVGQSAARWKMTLRKGAARTPLGRVAGCARTHVQARGHPVPRRPTDFGPDGNGTPTPRDVRRATAPCARTKTGEECQPCPDRPLGYWDLKPPHSIMALGARAHRAGITLPPQAAVWRR